MSLPLLIQFTLCPVVLFALLRVSAPYGRHGRGGWGPLLPSRAAWALMELPALLVIGVLVLTSPAAKAPGAWVPLLFWFGHYAYRTFVFPALMRPSGSPFPIVLVLFAIAFNVLNGYNNAQALVDAGGRASPLLSLHFVAGATIFLAGFSLHVSSDLTIRNLRRQNPVGYGIPQGGLFRWVGSPNYLGEIIQWSGWAVMTWSLAGLAFALFTFCNLAPRAVANHRWYRNHFSGYPPDRKILVPGLF
ncbi:MAG: DUF1295 domain-containing protein [Lysobacterales bacterium]|jgi:hypothetical protein